MERFIPALERLSRGGMSEDESDHGGEDASDQGQGEDRADHVPESRPKKRRYKILKVQWRSMEVAKWLRTMDLIYGGTKINEDGTATRGNEFRKRYPSDEMQIGRPIMGLPRNFYDARWLQELSPEQLVVLDVQPEIDINFTIDERKYVPFCAANPPEIEILLTLNEDTQQNTSPRTVKSRRMGLPAMLKQTRAKYHSGH
jgi:hypothetical protein